MGPELWGCSRVGNVYYVHTCGIYDEWDRFDMIVCASTFALCRD